MLTLEQRWLLMTMGGWQIVDALIGPGGVNHLMQSQWSGNRFEPIPGAPEWMTSWSTGNGRIVSPWGRDTEPRVTVTAAQINRYARTIPDEVRGQLEAIALQRSQHTWKSYDWCWCGRETECRRANAGDPLYGDRYHPTEREISQHHADARRIRAYEGVYLAKALRLTAADLEPSGQLDLFEAAL